MITHKVLVDFVADTGEFLFEKVGRGNMEPQ